MNEKLLEKQLTSTYRGKVILKIFAQKGAQETRRFARIKPYVEKRTLISIYNAIVRPSTISVMSGMCSVKLNQSHFKNYKIGLLKLYWM